MSLMERFRDKTRDKLTQALIALGIRAEMAERGRAEESVNNSWYQRSLGVIDLQDGPVDKRLQEGWVAVQPSALVVHPLYPR